MPDGMCHTAGTPPVHERDNRRDTGRGVLPSSVRISEGPVDRAGTGHDSREEQITHALARSWRSGHLRNSQLDVWRTRRLAGHSQRRPLNRFRRPVAGPRAFFYAREIHNQLDARAVVLEFKM